MTDQAATNTPTSLSSAFNIRAPRYLPKTETEIRVGVRKESDGSTVHVRAGKVISRMWADGSRDSHGAEVKQRALQQRAVQEKDRRLEVARMAQSRKHHPSV